MKPAKTTAPRTYVSARERLLALGQFGPVLEARLLTQMFNWTPKAAAHYLWLWSRQGLIAPLGGKSGVFLNLVADPQAGDHIEAALRRAYPGAVIGAANVLHQAGVTTQRAARLQLLLRPDEPQGVLDVADVHPRSATWWAAIDTAKGVAAGTEEALARLTVGAALADAAYSKILAPDDIDFDEVPAGESRRAIRILRALTTLIPEGADLPAAYATAWLAPRPNRGPRASTRAKASSKTR